MKIIISQNILSCQRIFFFVFYNECTECCALTTYCVFYGCDGLSEGCVLEEFFYNGWNECCALPSPVFVMCDKYHRPARATFVSFVVKNNLLTNVLPCKM